MNHRAHIISAFLFLLFLVACSSSWTSTLKDNSITPEKTVTRSSMTTVILTKISTPTPVPQLKTTAITPSPSTTFTKQVLFTATATITPTIFYSPFAIRSFTTVPEVQCPNTLAGIVPTPDFVFVHPLEGPKIYVTENELIDFLNVYGTAGFYSAYQKVGGKNWPGSIQFYGDLTNDGISELAFGAGSLYIFGCKDGHYNTLFEFGPDAYLHPPKITNILDANRNGLPEITLLLGYLSQGGHSYQVLEWDGKQFQSLLIPKDGWSADSIFVEAPGNLVFADVDHDGVVEYIANIGIPIWETYSLGIPWRNEKQIYKWNGAQFVFDKRIFSAPEYRFQAVQDGDRATSYGDLDSALNFYRMAIYNNNLQGWSPERRDFVSSVFFGRFSNEPTPVPPLPDPEEHDNLTAYARYRIMLNHLAHGWVSDAKVVFDTLQKEYPEGKPGHIYAALAENTWTAFSQTKDLGKACDKALEFVSQSNEDIFYYISGSGFPGNHGINYKNSPELICPFE